MFDPKTADLLRSAPRVPGLDPLRIPQLITRHYASLVSSRLGVETQEPSGDEWSLERIADTYEIIAITDSDEHVRRPAAFVAATAQLVISRRQHVGSTTPASTVSRDRVDPSLTAALLFLISEQYADASESAQQIKALEEPDDLPSLLTRYVDLLARGRPTEILRLAKESNRLLQPAEETIQDRALAVLLAHLAQGIESLAAELLGIPRDGGPAINTFQRVQALCWPEETPQSHGYVIGSYAGPSLLASLLIAVAMTLEKSALVRIGAPDGSSPEYWGKWIGFRASVLPYVWPNHRDIIAKGFHAPGVSAVLVLPTGAGKTTISGLKIAATLATGKRIIFLAPTHALVEQLTDDLQEMFPKDVVEADVSSDFDMPTQDGSGARIEIMTPERCLAAVTYDPQRFSDVGLLVFDECHLLSPASGSIRRALDGMLCVLALNNASPNADMLYLSAMLQNGIEFSEWISTLTGRPCIGLDLLWKPSRQARGVVVYAQNELDAAVSNAMAVQLAQDSREGRRASNIRTSAENSLRVRPHAIWGLQHNWLNKEGNTASFLIHPLLGHDVQLKGKLHRSEIHLRPNANEISANIAIAAAKSGLKTIIFVNNRSHAVKAARDISSALQEVPSSALSEKDRWEALEEELGSLAHSLVTEGAAAVPHNASMLKLERDLAERSYRRKEGAAVIVATPTLAQGLNLPAGLAILAGDKRTDANSGERNSLQPHELLNAAARAGRAGHLANGVVLLVPEPVLGFRSARKLTRNAVEKLQTILPEDDRCVVIFDPIELILDRISAGHIEDEDVAYTVNRMSVIRSAFSDDAASKVFDLNRSFGAFLAKMRNKEADFYSKIEALREVVTSSAPADSDLGLAMMSSKTGLPIDLMIRLRDRLRADIGHLPNNVEAWINWLFLWMSEDERSRERLLFDIGESINVAVGRARSPEIDTATLNLVHAGVKAWITGKTVAEIELELGGNPNSDLDTQRTCPRARELISAVIPRGLAYAASLITTVAEDVHPFDSQEDLSIDVIECLGVALRRGFDSPQLVNYAQRNPKILSRVQLHKAFRASADEFWLSLET